MYDFQAKMKITQYKKENIMSPESRKKEFLMITDGEKTQDGFHF